jgi:flavin reductase (DIM6/NTAB) family NADH-FMN oxidoreductase RutF
MDLTHDMLNHGVNVVCAAHEGKVAGLAVAWATQVGTDRVLICVGSQSATRELILASGAFALSVLAKDQIETARLFGTKSSRDTDKLAGLGWSALETGSPVLDDCEVRLDCRVERVFELDKLRLIVGKVVRAERGREARDPLVYRDDDY